jgi:la-related protein 1
MVASAVPVDKTNKTESQGEEHSSSTTASADQVLIPASPSVPSVNVWDARKGAMKPPISTSAEQDAEKRVESIIENIKEVTLGKSGGILMNAYRDIESSFEVGQEKRQA